MHSFFDNSLLRNEPACCTNSCWASGLAFEKAQHALAPRCSWLTETCDMPCVPQTSTERPPSSVSPGSPRPSAAGELGSWKSSFSPFAFQVTLCSNTVQKYELALVVDVEGIGEEVLALLITARYRSPAPLVPVSLGPGKGCLSRRRQACQRPTLHLFCFPRREAECDWNDRAFKLQTHLHLPWR